MASTTFIDQQTVIYAAWLNDVNNAVYNGIFAASSISPTNLVCNGSVSGTGFTGLVNNTLSAPGQIGNATPNTGAFTTLSATTPIAVTSGGTGVATSTGSGANVLGTSPTIATPTITGTITDGTNNTTVAACAKGTAKAWVNFGYNGSAIVIKSSYNVTSVTRNSTGNYTVNFTTAFANTNYAVQVSKSINDSISGTDTLIPQGYASATGSCNVGMCTYQGTFFDCTTVSVSVFS